MKLRPHRLAACALYLTTATGLAQPLPADQMARHHQALLALCPAQPEPDGASSLPIDVRHLGTAGPRVLLIHGGVQGSLGGGPATFTRQDALAESSWRVDSVSRPGFGPSPSRGPDDMDKDAVWIAKMFGGGTNVIAHSWGAAEALLAAARRPAQVQSLILVEPALQNLLAGDPVLRDDPVARSAADKFRQIALSANTPGEYSVGFAASVAGAKPALDPNSETAEFAGCALLRANMATASEMRAAAETVAREDIPVLVITGGWSPFFDAVGEAAARATQGRHVIVKSPGHMVQLESSADFNATVEAFMLEADVQRPAK